MRSQARLARAPRVGVLATLAVLTLGAGVVLQYQKASAAPPPLVDPQPVGSGAAGPVHVTAQLDRGAVARGGDGLVKMELVIEGRASGEALARVPTDLVVVLDRSGSMQGAPLHHAKAAIAEILSGLSPQDRFGLVAYSSGAHAIVPLQLATPDAVVRMRGVAQAVAAGGGTNMASGIDLGLATLERRPGRAVRMLLLSDGHANEGDHSLEGLRARVSRVLRQEGVVSTVGLGDGFNESLMTSLADAGTGNFYYVRGPGDLGQVFASEFASARETVAQGVAVTLQPAAGVEVLDAAGYPLEREGSLVRFRPGALFAGQERRIWVTLRAPTGEVGELAPTRVRVGYKRGGTWHEVGPDSLPQLACVAEEEEAEESVDLAAWARGVVVDEVGRLKLDVSSALQGGRLQEAKDSVARFLAAKKRENRARQQAPVAAAIAEGEALLDDLERDADRPEARNAMSKTLSADGYDARRVGGKYNK